MHGGLNFCGLKGDSKTSQNFFFLLHSFTDRRFALTIGFSSLSKQLILSLISWELSPSPSKEVLYDFSLAYLNGQHHYSCALVPLQGKRRVTLTLTDNQSDKLDGY